jgi:hypothetical protein
VEKPNRDLTGHSKNESCVRSTLLTPVRKL